MVPLCSAGTAADSDGLVELVCAALAPITVTFRGRTFPADPVVRSVAALPGRQPFLALGTPQLQGLPVAASLNAEASLGHYPLALPETISPQHTRHPRRHRGQQQFLRI